MRIRFSDLYRWDGAVDRGPYLFIGIVGFAIKYNLDRLVAYSYFERVWSPIYYLIPGAEAVTELGEGAARFYTAILALALPFIYVGVVLTLRRLRAIEWPPWLIVLFFVPVLNLIYFIVLSVVPSRQYGEVVVEQPGAARSRRPTVFDRIIPDHAIGSAAMSLLIVLPVGLAATLLSVSALGNYGWGLFVGLPFALGLVSVLLFGHRRARRFSACMSVAVMSQVLLGGGLIACAVEGAICIMMAAPLACALALFGGCIGYLIQKRPGLDAPPVFFGVLLGIPLLMGAERMRAPQSPRMAVCSSVVVKAPPAQVWRHVVAFAALPPPRETLFRLGIAYPQRAEIRGRGVGAERHCVFSTGAFVEPITVWDEPRLLRFSVTSNPPPMEEWTPYGHIAAPHLKDFLVSNGGQFRLTPLGGHRTRLEGTTWYRHSMWPVAYWQRWSDTIIHKIHLRVLRHVKALAENETV